MTPRDLSIWLDMWFKTFQRYQAREAWMKWEMEFEYSFESFIKFIDKFNKWEINLDIL